MLQKVKKAMINRRIFKNVYAELVTELTSKGRKRWIRVCNGLQSRHAVQCTGVKLHNPKYHHLIAPVDYGKRSRFTGRTLCRDIIDLQCPQIRTTGIFPVTEMMITTLAYFEHSTHVIRPTAGCGSLSFTASIVSVSASNMPKVVTSFQVIMQKI